MTGRYKARTCEVLLHLAELPVFVFQLHIIVQVKVFLPQVEELLAVHPEELLLAREHARADLEDRKGVLAGAGVLLDFEGIAGEGQHLFFDDELDGVVVVEKVAADWRVDAAECHVDVLMYCGGFYRLLSLCGIGED